MFVFLSLHAQLDSQMGLMVGSVQRDGVSGTWGRGVKCLHCDSLTHQQGHIKGVTVLEVIIQGADVMGQEGAPLSCRGQVNLNGCAPQR